MFKILALLIGLIVLSVPTYYICILLNIVVKTITNKLFKKENKE